MNFKLYPAGLIGYDSEPVIFLFAYGLYQGLAFELKMVCTFLVQKLKHYLETETVIFKRKER